MDVPYPQTSVFQVFSIVMSKILTLMTTPPVIRGLDPPPQKRNIARITKAALQRCLGKSSLNVNRIFPVCPVLMSDVIHFDNDDHLLCYLMILKAQWIFLHPSHVTYWSVDSEIVVQNIDDAIWWCWRHIEYFCAQPREQLLSKTSMMLFDGVEDFPFAGTLTASFASQELSQWRETPSLCRPCTPRRSCAPHCPRGVRLALSIIQGILRAGGAQRARCQELATFCPLCPRTEMRPTDPALLLVIRRVTDIINSRLNATKEHHCHVGYTKFHPVFVKIYEQNVIKMNKPFSIKI